MRSVVCGVLGVLCVSAALLAQHEYPATDVENGGRLFMASCAGCHGPDGDQVPGVNLLRGQFRRASSDEELVDIIRNGLPDTGMPPNNISEPNAKTIVAYLRTVATETRSVSASGNAESGRALFEGKGACATCHRVGSAGSRLGPDLTAIGGERRAVELERSILEPAAVVLPNHRQFRVVTRDGVTVTGRLLNHDRYSVQLLDSKERLVSFQKTDLREYDFVDGTSMPSYRDRLSASEVADVVSYLVSLKGRGGR
jgi:putative heme-binding domain-containing protein